MVRALSLLERWLVDRPGEPELGRNLLERYAEPHRHYHDRAHLREVLDAVDVLAEHAADPAAVRLAAWFHDAIYDPRASDNEAASARLAVQTLSRTNLRSELVTEVARLVELTATHQPDPDDANGAVLCDADLAILAADAERYARYVADVRSEYAHVDDEAFRTGRRAVLEWLQQLQPLYRTPTAHRRWEPAARANLDAELATLTNPSDEADG